MTELVRTTVRFPSALKDQVARLARTRRVDSTTIYRLAAEDYLRRAQAGENPVQADLTRIALTTEFTQASLDVLLREIAPDKRDEVLLTVQQRMEQFHGQK